jgi:hypothetical protein
MQAPHLLDIEVAGVLRRLVPLKGIRPARAEQARDEFRRLRHRAVCASRLVASHLAGAQFPGGL